MIKLNGKCVFEGIVLGRLSFYKRGERQIGRYCTQDPTTEIDRFEAARAEAAEQLKELYGKALQRVGKANAMIFEIHIAMLNDPDYCAAVIDVINTQHVNAEYAVAASAEKFSEMLENIDDGYIKARAADVKDVSERMLNILSDTAAPAPSDGGPVIIAAEDLAPSETVQLDKEKVLAFVTMFGSINSHTAILARTMGIPAVIDVGKNLLLEYEGCDAAVDGSTGTVYINPDEKTQRMLLKKHSEEMEKHALLKRLSAEECITLDGKRINVVANVGGLDDVETALENGADGIGLFRSEFLYLENDDFPTEEEQFRVYKATAEKMSGRSVVIRTLDVGADKRADYFCLPEEKNPAMGCRAVRFCLMRQDIFKTQLRAIFRASAFGRVAVMFPMIISEDEIFRIKAIVSEVKNELAAEGQAFSDNVELGVMIETPAAAMISDVLAAEVDFFSIGTNDLAQYTLAIDRQNQRMESFYNPSHKGVLRLIKIAVDNARKNGIHAGICGEIGADISLTETLIGLGVDEFSVPPPCIPALSKRIKEINAEAARKKMLCEI